MEGVEQALTRLVRAQRLEERLVVLKRRAESLPAELSERAAGVHATAAEADQADGERRASLSKAQDLENDVRVREARAAKLEEQALRTRDASGAAVARHEAAELRARSAEAQDQALGLLERAEQLAGRAAELRARLAAANEDLERFRATVAADGAALDAEILQFTVARDELLAGFDAAAREHFAAVARRNPGKVVAPLKGDSCGGCGTRMVPNDAVRVRAKNAFFRCPSCARFLVTQETWAAAERASAADG